MIIGVNFAIVTHPILPPHKSSSEIFRVNLVSACAFDPSLSLSLYCQLASLTVYFPDYCRSQLQDTNLAEMMYKLAIFFSF